MLLAISAVGFRPQPSARAVLGSQLAMCDGAITDIASFMQQVRATKAAIATALRAEEGAVSEDMRLAIEGLSSVNPTAPDPAVDIDLWAGGG